MLIEKIISGHNRFKTSIIKKQNKKTSSSQTKCARHYQNTEVTGNKHKNWTPGLRGEQAGRDGEHPVQASDLGL